MPILGILASRDGGTPTAPTIGTATAGDASATVAYTASTYTGKGAATYLATSSPGSLTGTGASPITVSGLTNGTAYTFTVKATSTTGETATSAASNSVTPATASSFESIATSNPTSGSTVTFSSIAGTYKSLQVRMISKGAYTSPYLGLGLRLQFNGDTSASNYAMHYLSGGNSIASASGTASGSYGYVVLYGADAGVAAGTASPAASIIDVIDYASATKYKTVRAFSGVDYNGAVAGISSVTLNSGLWLSTSAITSLTITASGTGWVTGTSIALYGVK